MITRIVNTQEEQNTVQFVPFEMASVIFPDQGDTTSAYSFRGHYPVNHEGEENPYPRTLQIAFTDLYEMSNFIAEMQKALNYAFTRAADRALNPQPLEKADAVQAAKTSQS